MRITVRIDDRLLAEAKKRAAETGRTLTAVLEDALRASLAQRSEQPISKPVRLKTFKGVGIRTGVDLDDCASLLRVMES